MDAAVQPGIEAPQLFAAARIQRRHLIERRADIQPTLGENRRVLERGALDRIAFGREIAG